MKMCSTKVLMWLVFTASSYGGRNSLAWAQAPANDACTNAAALTIGGTPQIVNVFNAVPGETGVPNPCRTGAIWATFKGVWYTFTGTGARVAFPACEPNYQPPIINVYSGAACGTTTLTCVAHIPNGCQNQNMFDTVAGTKYYVAYSSFDATTVANSNLVVSLVNAPVPTNEVCSGATPLTIGGPSVTGNITFAKSDETEVLNSDGCSGTTIFAGVPGLWYSFQGTGGHVSPSTCFPDSIATDISVYKGTCGPTTLQCVSGGYNQCTKRELFTLKTEVGVTYYALVRSASGPSRIFQFSIRTITPPSNDVCSAATPIAIDGPTVTGNITFAKSDETEVLNSDGCSGTTIFADVPGLWYSFQGTGGYVWPSTCFPDSIATDISVYKGTCGTTLQCVSGGYNQCTKRELFTFKTEVGVTYYALVRSASGPSRIFRFSIRTITPPSNDVCSSARPIPVGSSIVGDIMYAKSDEKEVASANGCSVTTIFADVPGLWYSFQGTGGRVWLSTCFPNSIATDISVYKGSCGLSTLQCVTGAYWPCRFDEKFTLNTDAGITYYVLVRSASGPSRIFQFLVSSISPAVSTNVNANDFCTNSSKITFGSTTAGNLSLATADGGDVPGDCLAGNPIGARPGLWYSFDGTGRNVTTNVCSRTSMSTHVSVYKGASCGSTTLQCVAGSYDTCALPTFTFRTDVGSKYYVLVRAASTSTTGSRIFDLTTYSEAEIVALPTTAPNAVSAPVPILVGAPKAPSAPVPSAPVPVKAPSVPVPSAPVPVTAPTTADNSPKKCGLLGFRLFCPLTRCGLVGRLLGICKK